MTHEVEASHEKNEINEQQPMMLERDLSFFDEDLSLAVCIGCFSHALTLLVRFCLGKHETEDDEKHRWTSTEPEQRTPVVGSRVDETSCESGAEKNTTHKTTRFLGTVFKSGLYMLETADLLPSRATPQEQGSFAGDATDKFEDDEEKIVDHERPLSTVAIARDTKGNGADGSEHENQCNSPCDVGFGLAECFGKTCYGEGDGEEVECVPRL
ncbi:hypothetical protein HG530_000774 [Fusarium avenaceum]|nr:hypothetical protein HG530_000774 [Fusarium avenaceum]